MGSDEDGTVSDGGTTFDVVIRDLADYRVAVLQVSGDLDDATAEELADQIDRHFDSARRALVLDLTGASNLGPAVAEMLTDRARRAGEGNIGFYLVAGARPVRQALRASSGRDLLDISVTVASAIRAAR
jgi:anti-anti-sigma factor